MPKTVSPIRLSEEAYPERHLKMQEMGYDGNRLLRKLQKSLPRTGGEKKENIPSPPLEPELKLGQKLFFHKS